MLGRGGGGITGSLVHYGGPECDRRLPELSTPGPGVLVDTCPGCRQLSPDSVAGHSRPVCRLADVSSAGILFPTGRPDVCGHRHVSTVVGWAPGICLPSLCTDLLLDLQVACLQGDLPHPDCSFLATERVVSGAPEPGCGSSGTPSTLERFLTQPHIHHLHQNLPVLCPHAWQLYNALPAL